MKSPIKCDKRCGRGCTLAEYNAAVAGAKALCKKLGKGWLPSVWDNLGWHYSAYMRGLNVHVHANRHGGKLSSHSCFVNFQKQFVTTAKDPRKALALAMKEMDEHISILTHQAAALHRRVKGSK